MNRGITMNYKLGNSKYINSQGETEELTCPKCSQIVNFSVFTNFEARIIPKLPLVKAGSVFFLVCPNCSSIFTVKQEVGNVFAKGEKLAIGNYDLKELDKFEL